MSPVLSKEGKSDGSRYKKIENCEKHEESGLSCFLFPRDETDSVHLSHLPLFFSSVAPEKGPTEPSPSQFLSPAFLPSLCSSPWLALTHWSASGWKNRGTLLWVCYRRWREGERRYKEGRDRRLKEQEEEEEEEGGCSGKRNRNRLSKRKRKKSMLQV